MSEDRGGFTLCARNTVEILKKGNYSTKFQAVQILAERGDPQAQNLLGVAHVNGYGVTQDYQQAFKWFSKAAEQGHPCAQKNLGVMYGSGQVAPQDYVLSHMWFNIAGANGDENAMKGRDIIDENMTKSQIEKAQLMAQEWYPIKLGHVIDIH